MSSASPAPSFSGVVPPVATPLLPDGTIDHASLTRLVERLIDEGVSGLFALGSTGETAYFTDDQRVELLGVCYQRVTIDIAGDRHQRFGAVECLVGG